MIYEFKDGYLSKHLKYQYINDNEEWDEFLERIDFKGTNVLNLLFVDTYGIEVNLDSRNEKHEYCIELTIDGNIDVIFTERFEEYMSFLAKYMPMIESLISIYRSTIKAEGSILFEHLGQ